MSQVQLKTLLGLFEKSYVEHYKAWLCARKVDFIINYCIANEKDLLLFTLFSLESGLTYDVLGLVCGMNASNAKRNQHIGLTIFQKTLDLLGHLLKRKLLSVQDFETLFKNEKDLMIDATEQQIQRPRNDEVQKETYSGKKSPHLKTMVITTKSKVIKYLSNVYISKDHGFFLLKTEFPPVKNGLRIFISK